VAQESGLNLKLKSDSEQLKWQRLALQMPMHPNVYRSDAGSTSKLVFDEESARVGKREFIMSIFSTCIQTETNRYSRKKDTTNAAAVFDEFSSLEGSVSTNRDNARNFADATTHPMVIAKEKTRSMGEIENSNEEISSDIAEKKICNDGVLSGKVMEIASLISASSSKILVASEGNASVDGTSNSLAGKLMINAADGDSNHEHEAISVDVSATSLLGEPIRSEFIMRDEGRDSPLGQFNESDNDSQENIFEVK